MRDGFQTISSFVRFEEVNFKGWGFSDGSKIERDLKGLGFRER